MTRYYPDISNWHPVKDWQKVKDNCPFVISKATEGTTYVDTTLKSFISGCEKYKIPYLLYTFLKKGGELTQTKFMVTTCKNFIGNYFQGYILDVESKNSASGVKAALNYLEGLGGKCGIYTMWSQYDTYKSVIQGRKSSTFWWEAIYGANTGKYDTRRYPCHTAVDLHQYTDKGFCPGIGTAIDMNRLTGKKDESYFTGKQEEAAKAVDKSFIITDFSKYSGLISNSGSDEKGGYSGGKAGDQTGREWYIRTWYNRPWNCVLRYPDEKVRDCIATLAIEAAKNDKIGYDQNQRDTYWTQLQKVGYRPSKIKTACEADCSAGVIANTKATGYILGISALKNITATYTGDMRSKYKAAGFKVLTESKYLTGTAYLLPGDILLNDASHVATNLGKGSKAVSESKSATKTVSSTKGTSNKVRFTKALQVALNTSYGLALATDGDCGKKTQAAISAHYLYYRITKPIQNTHVSWLQDALSALGYTITVDGSFGPMTRDTVKLFQKKNGLTIDGSAGLETHLKILKKV